MNFESSSSTEFYNQEGYNAEMYATECLSRALLACAKQQKLPLCHLDSQLMGD